MRRRSACQSSFYVLFHPARDSPSWAAIAVCGCFVVPVLLRDSATDEMYAVIGWMMSEWE